jgi:D-alanine transaminase
MWVYLNGEIIPADEAKISPLDRSFTFGDGVYEVIPSYNQELFLFEEHLQRFKISLAKTFIPAPTELDNLENILKKLHVKNEFHNQSFYIQITRGVQESRSHMASENIVPTLFINSQNLDINPYRGNSNKEGLRVRLEDDIRWQRCDIKTTALIGNILSMHDPSLEIVDEILLHKDGILHEGSKSNVFLVKQGKVYTPSLNQNILPGVTRNFIIDLLKKNNIEVFEEEISVDSIYECEELWLTSSTKEIQPVSFIDDYKIPTKKTEELIWNKALKLFNPY